MSNHAPSRADVTSRARAADSWDAGVHAESEVGPIDFGLAVEPSALGLIIEAPHLGRLQLAFDVDARGVTVLSAASRHLTDGRDAALQPFDAATAREVERLKARIQALEDRAAVLESERNEARDRAALITDDRRRLETKVMELKAAAAAQREAATANLEVERTARLQAVSDKERLREELDALTAASDTSRQSLATLQASLANAEEATEHHATEAAMLREERDGLRALLEQAQAEAADAASQAQAFAARVAELEATLASAGDEAQALRGEAAQRVTLQTELEDTTARLQALEAEAEALRASADQVPGLQTDLELARARIAELEAASGSLTAEASQIPSLQAELEQARARLSELEASQLELDTARARVDELTTQVTSLDAALAETRAALDQAESGASASSAIQAELETLRAQNQESLEVIQSWQAALATEQTATVEAREIARQLKQQVDQLVSERDEARGIARQLHQKITSSPGAPAAAPLRKKP